jgi:RNA polymerase sigma-70 factor (ECF subfamily)
LIESAYRRYFPLIREKCRRMLGDLAEADDVAQETFVRLWQSSLENAEPRRLVSWIYRTSTRLAIDRLRQRARRPSSDGGEERAVEELAALSPDSEDALATRRALERLARALPEGELEMALLHRLDGLSQAEIAAVAQVSERTVRRCLERFDRRVGKLGKEMAR